MDTTTATPSTTEHATRQLAPLLRAAATTDLGSPAFEHLTAQARRTLRELIAEGAVPAHLTVAADDAPIVVVRTVIAAWRHVTATPERLSAVG